MKIEDTQEKLERPMLGSKDAVNAKIRRGIDHLGRAEGIPEDGMDAYLGKLKKLK